jgi:hypothetical protein
LLAWGFLAGSVAAQKTATLTGLIFTVDAQGEQTGWPNARVTLRHPLSGAAYSTVSDETGEYSFPNLEAGEYEVTVALEGFENEGRKFTLVAGADKRLDFEMRPRGPQSRVNVAAGAQQVDTQTPETGQLSEIRVALKSAILLNDQFHELLPLVPGVLRGSDGLLNIKGARHSQSGTLVNSTSVVDPVTGQQSLSLPLEAVNDIRVLPNPFSAEHGRFAGGVVSIETRSGGDAWKFHITGLWPRVRFRDGHFHGLRAVTPRVTFSGPIARGRLFLFQALDYHFVRTRFNDLPPLHDETTFESFDSFTQLDWNLNATNKLTGSVAIFPQNLLFTNLSTFFTEPATANFRQRGFFVILNERAILSGGGFLDSAFSVKRFDAHPFAATFDPAGLTLFPEAYSGGWHHRQDRESFAYSGGQTFHLAPAQASGFHFFLLGYLFERATFDGTVSYLPVTLLRPDGSRTQQITYGAPASLQEDRGYFAFFVQDRWQIVPRFTVDLGLRMDHEGLSRDRVNVAPRVAFVFAPTRDNKTAIRAGVGLFFDKLPLALGAFTGHPAQTITDFAADGLTILRGPRTFTHRIATPSGELRTPYSLAWTLQLDRELASRLLLRLGYEQRETHRDNYLEPVESLLPPLAELQLRDTGRQRYREFQALLRWRAGERSILFFSYVRSSADGDLNTFDTHFGNYPWPVIRPNQRGPLPFEARNRFLFWGTIGLPWKLELFPVMDITGGFPFSALDADWNFVGLRNRAGRFPRLFSLDIQVTRKFSIPVGARRIRTTVGIRVFNITNHFNPRDVQQHTGSPRFGQFFNSVHRKFRMKFDLEF